MRINNVSQNDAISKYVNNVSDKPVKSQAGAGIADSVELSEGAQKYASLLKTARDSMSAADVSEEEKVADIMARMSNNSYQIPTEDVVSGIMSGIPTHI